MAIHRRPTRCSFLRRGTAAKRGAPRIDKASDRRLKDFREALDNVLRDLAFQVVRDGEGARKFVSITVEGAASRKSAKIIARSIANSPLVKTAIAGEDANWGSRGDGRRQSRRTGGAPINLRSGSVTSASRIRGCAIQLMTNRKLRR